MRELRLGKAVTFQTPAKVNLHLYVQKKQPDGYHQLALDLVPISLFDRLELLPCAQGGLWFLSEPELCPPEENLVVKAIRALERKRDLRFSLMLKLNKFIPAGAGLGGGSGNAAGVLVVLNRLFDLALEPNVLAELAVGLGADVPFFLDPKPQKAHGIGADFTPLNGLAPWPLLLVKPDLFISTAQAYQSCEHSGRALPSGDYGTQVIRQLGTEDNDFFTPLAAQFPQLNQIKKALEGTQPMAVQFSGSGSVVYGVYETEVKRDQALKQVGHLGQVFSAQMLPHYSYPLV